LGKWAILSLLAALALFAIAFQAMYNVPFVSARGRTPAEEAQAVLWGRIAGTFAIASATCIILSVIFAGLYAATLASAVSRDPTPPPTDSS
jgi:hypothetical protein